jgi:hypothetical protein
MVLLGKNLLDNPVRKTVKGESFHGIGAQVSAISHTSFRRCPVFLKEDSLGFGL